MYGCMTAIFMPTAAPLRPVMKISVWLMIIIGGSSSSLVWMQTP